MPITCSSNMICEDFICSGLGQCAGVTNDNGAVLRDGIVFGLPTSTAGDVGLAFKYAALNNVTIYGGSGLGGYSGDMICHSCVCNEVYIYHNHTKVTYDAMFAGSGDYNVGLAINGGLRGGNSFNITDNTDLNAVGSDDYRIKDSSSLKGAGAGGVNIGGIYVPAVQGDNIMTIVYKLGIIQPLVINRGIVGHWADLPPGGYELSFIVTGNIVAFTNPSGTTGTWDYLDNTGTDVTVDPTHEYFVAGVYNVTYTDDGDASVSTAPVNIVAHAMPDASFTYVIGDPNTAVHDFTPTGAGAAVWDIDGNEYTTNLAQHEFLTADTFFVTLRMSDGYGNTSYTEQNIPVLLQNVLPSGTIEFTKDQLDVDWTAVNVVDPDGENTNQVFVWDFGDETISNYQNPGVHTYPSPTVPLDPAGQTFNASCTVTDERGGVSVFNQAVTVYDFTTFGSQEIADHLFDGPLDSGWVDTNGSEANIITDGGRSVMHCDSTLGSQGRNVYTLDLIPGRRYRLRATVKGDDAGGGTFPSININDDGVHTTNYINTIGGDGVYAEFSQDFTASIAAVEIWVFVRQAGNFIWVDEMHLQEIS